MPILEAITGFLSAVKNATPVVLTGVLFATGFGLVASDGAMARFGLAELRKGHRSELGLIFIAAGSLLAAQGAAAIMKMIRTRLQRRREQKRGERALDGLRQSLHGLTPDEKAYLEPFILGSENTLYFQIEDGIAGGLVAKEIMFRASNIGKMRTGFAHNLQPWAREHLTANPQLLDGASAVPTGGPPNWRRGW